MPASDHPVDQAVGLMRALGLLVEDCVDRDAFFDHPESAAILSEFLLICARSLTTDPAPGRHGQVDEFCQARDAFLRAGVDALLSRSGPRPAAGGWLQLGIRPSQSSRGALCQQISSLVGQLLDESTLDDFFFMNKPPGMRLRFHGTSAELVTQLADILQAHVERWRADGLVDYIEPGVYEPESELFGGPQSMNFVHALFTVDSLFWLDYHACRAAEGDAIGPAWLASLALLRAVFAGLEIVGWEDIGVWTHVRQMAGRQLREDKDSLPMYSEVARQIVSVWSRGDAIQQELHPAVKEIVDRYYSVLVAGAAQWRTGYFNRPGASLGTRAAAALFVVFHWNRAALSSIEQALLTESLSGRVLDDDRQ